MSLTRELSGWASALQLDDVPQRVVDVAKSQVLSQLAAVRAGLTHPLGATVARAFGPPLQRDARQAAATLSGSSAWLHFDDTAYAGHLSNSTVTVALAHAYASNLDGARTLTALIAANECAARITAATTLGPYRGQSATHTHLTGALAATLSARQAPVDRWVDAFGLAFAMPPRTLSPGFLGSDAKVLSAAVPVRAGIDACDAAAAGLRGLPDILEHPIGFLSRFSDIPLPEAVTDGLGTRWHTDTVSFKVHPGGPGVDAAVDCAIALHQELGDLGEADIAEVLVDSSLYTVFTDRQVRPYVTGPTSPVSALVFAGDYLVATALLTGSLHVGDFVAPAVTDDRRWRLAARTHIRHDPTMTRDLFRSDLPFGEALRLAGPRSVDWLRGFGAHVGDSGGQWLVDLIGDLEPPLVDFRHARKVTPAAVTVRLTDGRSLRRELAVPVGSVGSPERVAHPALVRAKFLSTGGSAEVADRLLGLEKLPADEVAQALTDALAPTR